MKKIIPSIALALVGLAACAHASTMAAETAYTTQQLRCVDAAHTLEESRACRKAVDLAWGITELEAGTDGGGK